MVVRSQTGIRGREDQHGSAVCNKPSRLSSPSTESPNDCEGLLGCLAHVMGAEAHPECSPGSVFQGRPVGVTGAVVASFQSCPAHQRAFHHFFDVIVIRRRRAVCPQSLGFILQHIVVAGNGDFALRIHAFPHDLAVVHFGSVAAAQIAYKPVATFDG